MRGLFLHMIDRETACFVLSYRNRIIATAQGSRQLLLRREFGETPSMRKAIGLADARYLSMPWFSDPVTLTAKAKTLGVKLRPDDDYVKFSL